MVIPALCLHVHTSSTLPSRILRGRRLLTFGLCRTSPCARPSSSRSSDTPRRSTRGQGLTLVHFSAQPEPFLALNTSPKRLNTPSIPALNTLQTPPNYPMSHQKRLRQADRWTSVSSCRAVLHCGQTLKSFQWPTTRGLHSFTFQLNVSAFYGIGGASRDCLGAVYGVLWGMRGCAVCVFVSETAQVELKTGRV
jgi:hypothetical protein